ncbi:MAG: DUF3185 family protein [Gammaproteobacteria bacterium]|nr:DUF3185 family protein [Gammaproteobacteria bacterium]
MGKKSRQQNSIAGIVLMVVGGGLAFLGYQKSGGLRSQLSSAFTGSPTDKVMALYIAGAACFAVGIYLFARK